MIEISENHHASCDVCGERPDMMLRFENFAAFVSLCEPCASSLANAIINFLAPKIPATSDEASR